jgi:hypothetical protein
VLGIAATVCRRLDLASGMNVRGRVDDALRGRHTAVSLRGLGASHLEVRPLRRTPLAVGDAHLQGVRAAWHISAKRQLPGDRKHAQLVVAAGGFDRRPGALIPNMVSWGRLAAESGLLDASGQGELVIELLGVTRGG